MSFHLPLLSATKPPGAEIVLSPSQIGRFDECKRRWAIEYVLKIRSPPHKSALLGTLIHAHLEAWLSVGAPPGSKQATERNGRPVKASKELQEKAVRIAQRMIRHLPPPGVATVERNFYLTTRRGHYYTGFIDFSYDGRGYDVLTYPSLPENISRWPVVGDHKSTSDLRYAKTEADLHNDLQGVIYAIAGCLGFSTEDLQLFWNYGTTKDRDALTHPVRTLVNLYSAMAKFENAIEPVAEEIIWHRVNATNPDRFPPSLSACDAYGGCPHRNTPNCNVTSQERFDYDMTTQDPNGTTQQDPNSMAARMALYPGNGAAPGGQPMFAPPGAGQPVYPPQTQTAPAMTFAPPGAPSYPQQPAYSQQPTGPEQYPPQGQAPQFAPPGAPQQPAYPPQQTFQQPAPAFQAPPQQQPPAAAPQFALPPAAAPQQTQLPFQAPAQVAPQPPYTPEHAPNAPELGRPIAAQPPAPPAMPLPAEADAAATKKRGRPAGSENKTLSRDQLVFIEGAKAAMASINFNATVEMAMQGGELLLEAFKRKFGKE